MDNVALAIYNYRAENNLTQRELAELAGIAPLSVFRYEKNKSHPNWKIMNKLSEIGVKFGEDYLTEDNDGNIITPECFNTPAPQEQEVKEDASLSKFFEDAKAALSTYTSNENPMKESTEQIIETVRASMPKDLFMGFLVGTALERICRWKEHKSSTALEQAAVYLNYAVKELNE